MSQASPKRFRSFSCSISIFDQVSLWKFRDLSSFDFTEDEVVEKLSIRFTDDP